MAMSISVSWVKVCTISASRRTSADRSGARLTTSRDSDHRLCALVFAVTELAASHYRVRELMELLGQPQHLISYWPPTPRVRAAHYCAALPSEPCV